MSPPDLIATALLLLEGGGRKGPPRQTNLKRALSTAYYAMFHALCWNNADCLVGTNKSTRSQPAWTQAYRAVEHGYAKNQCKNRETMARFPEEIRDFAIKFVYLQEKRHKADYDPGYRLTRSDVLTEIDVAEAAINKVNKTNTKDKRAFAVWTIMKKRAE